MDWMSDWIRQIVLIIFIATFIDLLMPSSSLERYVKLIMGLIIFVSILQPVLQLVLNEDKWAKFSSLFAPALVNDHSVSYEKLQENREHLTNVQQEEIKRQFQKSISAWVENQVAQKYHVKVVSAKVTADFHQDTPVIQKIEVQGLKTEPSSLSTEVIKPIQPIDVTNDQNNGKLSNQDSSLQQEVQTFIGSAWNIDVDQVTVQIHSS